MSRTVRKSLRNISGKGISSIAQFDRLDDYLSKSFILNRLCGDDIINKLDNNIVTGFTKDWARNIIRIDETHCLNFHDTVLAEVFVSSTRNVEKDVFIVRIIIGYSNVYMRCI